MTIEPKSKTKVSTSKCSGHRPARQQQLTKMLNRKSGASIAQIQKAFGW